MDLAGYPHLGPARQFHHPVRGSRGAAISPGDLSLLGAGHSRATLEYSVRTVVTPTVLLLIYDIHDAHSLVVFHTEDSHKKSATQCFEAFMAL